MPAGGMYPGLIPTLSREFGLDIIIGAGGGILGHPKGYSAGAKAMIQAAEAVADDLSLEEASRTRPELRIALKKWGVLKRPETPWIQTHQGKYHLGGDSRSTVENYLGRNPEN